MGQRLCLLPAGLILVCLFCACCALPAAVGYFYLREPDTVFEAATQVPPVGQTSVPAAEVPPATQAASCQPAMRQVIRAARGEPLGSSGSSGSTAVDPNRVILVTYQVRGDEIVAPSYRPVSSELEALQKDAAAQASAWDIFRDLVPAAQRSMVSKYVVFTDGPSSALAAVQQAPRDPALWVVEVDAADLGNRPALMFTLVHEFAHLLTLNAGQVPPDLDLFHHPEDDRLYESKDQSCSTYFPGEGCSLSTSYINAFYAQFWTDMAAEWQMVDNLSSGADWQKYEDELHAFYEAHPGQFVDDYAVTNPSEDIAETFAHFVFDSRPHGDNVAEQKVLFFYQYPELVELRLNILQSFCEDYPEP